MFAIIQLVPQAISYHIAFKLVQLNADNTRFRAVNYTHMSIVWVIDTRWLGAKANTWGSAEEERENPALPVTKGMRNRSLVARKLCQMPKQAARRGAFLELPSPSNFNDCAVAHKVQTKVQQGLQLGEAEVPLGLKGWQTNTKAE